MGFNVGEKVRSAKTYDRGTLINEPKTFSNQNYYNKPCENKAKPYEKGTKKFFERTEELYSSVGKKENKLIT